jgi:hypothetical protein
LTPKRRLAGVREPVCRQILKIVQQSLEEGHSVDIDGLGSFRTAPKGGGYEFVAESRPQVFVAYAVEDLAVVRRLCAALSAAGCHVWLDKDKLLPGQNWPRAIEGAIEFADAFGGVLFAALSGQVRAFSE